MNPIHMVTHDDDIAIPKGMAAIAMNNNGWVGTNNGWPLTGQPALFPQSQAHAICYAWNSFKPENIPNLDAVEADVKKWLI